jgi:hypothetical protein
MILGWAAVIAPLAAATVLAVSVLTPDRTAPTSPTVPAVVDGPQRVPGTPDAAEHWLTDAGSSGLPQGLPGTADAAAHWLTDAGSSGLPQGLPGTADAAAQWLADEGAAGTPQGIPGTADAAEQWLADE